MLSPPLSRSLRLALSWSQLVSLAHRYTRICSPRPALSCTHHYLLCVCVRNSLSVCYSPWVGCVSRLLLICCLIVCLFGCALRWCCHIFVVVLCSVFVGLTRSRSLSLARAAHLSFCRQVLSFVFVIITQILRNR